MTNNINKIQPEEGKLSDLEFYKQLLQEEGIRYKAGKCLNKQGLQSLKRIVKSLKKRKYALIKGGVNNSV